MKHIKLICKTLHTYMYILYVKYIALCYVQYTKKER